MEKRVFCQLNGNRKVIGVLRGYDVRVNRFPRPFPALMLRWGDRFPKLMADGFLR